MQAKQNIRQAIRSKRESLSLNLVLELSKQINKKLINEIDWSQINNLHIYQAIESKNEINTEKLIEFLKTNFSKINVYSPPQKAKEPTDDINMKWDLIIVPMIGFDRNGNRLGYGGGYYDKLLSKSDYKKSIGLAYSFCEIKNLPVEPHDQKIDLIITEKDTIKP